MRRHYPCKQPRTKHIPSRVRKCIHRGTMRKLPTPMLRPIAPFITYKMPKLPPTPKATKREVIRILLKHGMEIRDIGFPIMGSWQTKKYFIWTWVDVKIGEDTHSYPVYRPTHRALRLLEQWSQ